MKNLQFSPLVRGLLTLIPRIIEYGSTPKSRVWLGWFMIVTLLVALANKVQLLQMFW